MLEQCNLRLLIERPLRDLPGRTFLAQPCNRRIATLVRHVLPVRFSELRHRRPERAWESRSNRAGCAPLPARDGTADRRPPRRSESSTQAASPWQAAPHCELIPPCSRDITLASTRTLSGDIAPRSSGTSTSTLPQVISVVNLSGNWRYSSRTASGTAQPSASAYATWTSCRPFRCRVRPYSGPA